MVLRQNAITAEQFDVFILKPENVDKTFELIAGELVEKMPSNAYVSKIAAQLIILIGMYLRNHDLGHITGEGGGYMVNSERYAPDVAFISYEKQPELARHGYNPNPPDFAVEVLSEPDNRQEQQQTRLKLTNYLTAGVIVWVIDPDEKTVELHDIGQSPFVASGDTELTITCLPDFKLVVNDLFPQKREQ